MKALLIGTAMLAVFSLPAAAEPIATTDGNTPGQRVELTELKRGSGDTVTLKFTLINDSETEISSNDLRDTATSEYKSVGGIYLIDAVNQKKYLVVRDSEGNCLCSRDLPGIKAGQSVNMWAKFPAPPAEVDKITVVVPNFIPMDDVPISQ